MNPYIVILAVLIANWIISRYKIINPTYLLWFGIIILIGISSFKSISVGTDTYNYYAIFNNIVGYSNTSISQGVQQGYYYYTYLFNQYANYTVYLIACYTIAYSGVGILINKYSNDKCLSLIVFYLLFYLGSLNIMRQYMAIGIYCVGLCYLFKNKIKEYILFILIASLLHFSALIMLPLIWINKIPSSSKLIYCSVIGSFIIGFFMDIMNPIVSALEILSFLNNHAAGYINNWGNGEERNIITNLLINLAFLVSYYFNKKSFSNSMKLWFLFIVFNNLLGEAGQANRIFLYLLIGATLAIPQTTKNLKINKQKIIGIGYYVFIFTYIIGYWYAMLSLGINDVIPYKFR